MPVLSGRRAGSLEDLDGRVTRSVCIGAGTSFVSLARAVDRVKFGGGMLSLIFSCLLSKGV